MVRVVAVIDPPSVFLSVDRVDCPHVSGFLSGVHPEQLLGLCLSAEIVVDELAKPLQGIQSLWAGGYKNAILLAEMPIPVESKYYAVEDYDGDQAEKHVADCGTWIAPVQYGVDVRVSLRIRSARAIVHDAEDQVAANDDVP